MVLTAYTDGSCLEQNGVGGYAIMFIGEKGVKRVAKAVEETTNNRMEVEAVLEAMTIFRDKFKGKYEQMIIHSDSNYVINAFTKGWIETWHDNDWKKANGSKVKNVDQWERALELLTLNVRFVKVKAHDTNDFNNSVDELARGKARELQNKLKRKGGK